MSNLAGWGIGIAATVVSSLILSVAGAMWWTHRYIIRHQAKEEQKEKDRQEQAILQAALEQKKQEAVMQWQANMIEKIVRLERLTAKRMNRNERLFNQRMDKQDERIERVEDERKQSDQVQAEMTGVIRDHLHKLTGQMEMIVRSTADRGRK